MDEIIQTQREMEQYLRSGISVSDPNPKELIKHRDQLLAAVRKENEWMRKIPNRKAAYVFLGKIAGELQIPVKHRDSAISMALNDMYSYGPLQEAIDNPYVSDIQIIGGHVTLIVEKGERRESTEAFMSNDELYSFVIRKLAGTNYRFDLSNPRTDAMLPDGYRMNVKGGPTGWTVKDGQGRLITDPCLIVNIRKPLYNFTLEQLRDLKMFSNEIYAYLEWVQRLGEGFVIAGDVGSGKSTLMAAMMGKIPQGLLSGVLEEMPELQPLSSWTLRLFNRPENAEGKGAITMSDNLVDMLRMYLDNTYVGEVRTADVAYLFLENGQVATRQVGTTTHVKYGVKDGIERICALAMGDSKRPGWNMTATLFTTAVQHVIVVHKTPQGKRITQIGEILPYHMDSHSIPYVIVGDFEPTLDQFHFYGITPEMEKRAVQQGFAVNGLAVQENPEIHYVRMGE